MNKRMIEALCDKHQIVFTTSVVNAFDEIARNFHHDKRYEYDLLAQDLKRIVKIIEPQNYPTYDNLQQGVITLNDLIKGLTDPDYFKSSGQTDTPSATNSDPINPNHYKTQSGVECIDVAELFPYSLGNAIKYAWRAGKKDNLKQDLKKCEWYLNRAMDNGEAVCCNPPFSQDARRALRRFEKVKGDLPEYNATLLREILLGRFQSALDFLDAWITELD